MAYDVPLWSDDHLKLLDKTFSLFRPEVDKEMQPTWESLQKFALDGGVFGERALRLGEGGLRLRQRLGGGLQLAARAGEVLLGGRQGALRLQPPLGVGSDLLALLVLSLGVEHQDQFVVMGCQSGARL
jgi:hypothetical protein